MCCPSELQTIKPSSDSHTPTAVTSLASHSSIKPILTHYCTHSNHPSFTHSPGTLSITARKRQTAAHYHPTAHHMRVQEMHHSTPAIRPYTQRKGPAEHLTPAPASQLCVPVMSELHTQQALHSHLSNLSRMSRTLSAAARTESQTEHCTTTTAARPCRRAPDPAGVRPVRWSACTAAAAPLAGVRPK